MEIKPNVENAWSCLRPALETMCKSGLPLEDVQDMIMRAYIDVAIKECRGNISAAGRAIQVHRNTIYRYQHRR